MKKPFVGQKSLLLAAAISFAVHTAVVSFSMPSPIVLFLKHPPQTSKTRGTSPVYFELIDQPTREAVNTPPATPFIDSVNQHAKGREQTQKGPGLPHVEGTSQVKVIGVKPNVQKTTGVKNQEAVNQDLPNYFTQEPSFFFQKHEASGSDAVKERLFRNMAPPEVEDIGDPQFATQQNLMVPYLKRVKKKIFDHWYDLVRRQTTEFIGNRVVVNFQISKNGSVTNIEVKTQEGSDLYRDFCVTAIKNSSPFDPLPVEIPKYLKHDTLPIQFTFCYE